MSTTDIADAIGPRAADTVADDGGISRVCRDRRDFFFSLIPASSVPLAGAIWPEISSQSIDFVAFCFTLVLLDLVQPLPLPQVFKLHAYIDTLPLLTDIIGNIFQNTSLFSSSFSFIPLCSSFNIKCFARAM